MKRLNRVSGLRGCFMSVVVKVRPHPIRPAFAAPPFGAHAVSGVDLVTVDVADELENVASGTPTAPFCADVGNGVHGIVGFSKWIASPQLSQPLAGD
jgi:hypothetical protein